MQQLQNGRVQKIDGKIYSSTREFETIKKTKTVEQKNKIYEIENWV